MGHRPLKARIRTSFGLVLLILITLAFAIAIVRFRPNAVFRTSEEMLASRPVPELSVTGVNASIRTESAQVTRTLPTMSFRIEPGQSLNRRVAPGPFAATFAVAFRPGAVERARIGAWLQNGQLIVRHDGEVILSDAAGDQRRQSLSSPITPIVFSRDLEEFTFEFSTTGEGPSALRAIWQPEGSSDPTLLPSDGASPLADSVLRGSLLVRKLRCAFCHRSEDETLQAVLEAYPAPRLDRIGARAKPAWLREWLTDPGDQKPGTAMPDLAHGGAISADEIEDLTHFLVSMGGPLVAGESAADDALIRTGMVAYHAIGCFACHGSFEPFSALGLAQSTSAQPWKEYATLGDLAAKTTTMALANFLHDPLTVRPSGLMPSMQLTEREAKAIAAYLIARTATTDGTESAFVVDVQRAERGRSVYVSSGCANCHDPESAGTAGDRVHKYRSLEDVAAAPNRGCLAASQPPHAPDYGLVADRQRDLRAFLGSLVERRAVEVPIDELVIALRGLNCTACHAFHALSGPEQAVAGYFQTIGESAPDDAGRLPPDLSDAGAHLAESWMEDVLIRGARARPRLAVRMPDFGEDAVADLPRLLAMAAGMPLLPDQTSEGFAPAIGPASSGGRPGAARMCVLVDTIDD